MKSKVGIVKYEKPFVSVKRAVDLSGAFDHLKTGDRVFVKPNIVFWSRKVPMPPWGVITTTRVVEDVVKLLKDHGAGEIIIGEGTMTTEPGDLKTPAHAFETLGYNRLSKLYDVKILNLFEEKFIKVHLGNDITLNCAKELLDADFVVSVPVLKTHAQTIVSLSQKNLKGCLDIKSRKKCHSNSVERDLDFHVAALARLLPRASAVIDGIYSLERGPAYTGKARRTNIIAASADLLAADIAGAGLMGIDPADVPHLKIACKEKGIVPSIESIETAGEPISKTAIPHKWDFPFNHEKNLPFNLESIGVKGLSFPKFDHSLCTYCSEIIGPLQVALGNAWKGDPFDNVEILTGKIRLPSKGMNHTILMGKCQAELNRKNPDIKDAIIVPGCPPKKEKLISGLLQAGIDVDPSFLDNLEDAPALFMKRYMGKSEFTNTFYRI